METKDHSPEVYKVKENGGKKQTNTLEDQEKN